MKVIETTPLATNAEAAPSAAIALLSHDLRAAVSDIIGGLRLLPQDQFDPAARMQLERIRAAGEVLARLVEDGFAVLTGAEDEAASAGNIQLHRFVAAIEARWGGRAREKGIGLRISLCRNLPNVIVLDRVALERTLSNMLSNAIKYGDRGEVLLDIGQDNVGGLTFTVTDEGPGFSPEAMARLFQFGGRPTDSREPGQGFGMHISRNMSDRLGGTIQAVNLPDRGARVKLTIPAEQWSAEAQPQLGERPLPDLSRCKILVAEDSPTNQAILRAMLEQMGAECVIAADGVEALHWLERESFDIALVDIEMPRLSGLDLIRRLRGGNDAQRSLPIIAVTAYVLRANRDAILAAGANAILPKPFVCIAQLGLTIASQLPSMRADRPPTVEPAEPEGAARGLARLLDITGPSGAGELLNRLCADLRRNERDLLRAQGERNPAAARAAAHQLISLAGAAGSHSLSAQARQLHEASEASDAHGMTPVLSDVLMKLDRLITFVETERLRRVGV